MLTAHRRELRHRHGSRPAALSVAAMADAADMQAEIEALLRSRRWAPSSAPRQRAAGPQGRRHRAEQVDDDFEAPSFPKGPGRAPRGAIGDVQQPVAEQRGP